MTITAPARLVRPVSLALPLSLPLALVAGCASPSGADARVFHQDLAWAPDGRSLLLSRQERGAFRIVRVARDGSGLEPLTEPGACHASWSPDGSRFVFHAVRGKDGEILVARADGKVLDDLTRDPHDDTMPAWSPDGFRIAFISDRGGMPRLHVMDARGLGQLAVGEAEGPQSSPAWSPDGRSLVLTERIEGIDWVVLVAADGSARRRLARGTSPSWSPDGRRVVFGGDGGIYSMRPADKEPTFLLADGWCPRLAPDGERLAFLRGSTPSSDVWIAQADGSGARRLVAGR
jgi:Tol biopolymer transport system component